MERRLRSDRSRHIASIHQRGSTTQTTILCPVPGCRRSRGRGLSRPDKLTEHLRKVHNIRNTQSQRRSAVSIAGNNNGNAGYTQGLGESSMTGNVAALAPIATFGASSNIYNNQINAEYSYGMNAAGVARDFASTNTVEVASIDQLQGDVDVGLVGYCDEFDFANFNIGQPQDFSNLGMAATTNFIGNAAAVVPVATFGASTNVYNNTQYPYGMNTTGVPENLAFASASNIASNPSNDQLQGDVDVGLVGYPAAFDFANFNIGQPQGVNNVGMAAATNIIGNVDAYQLLRGVDVSFIATPADIEWADGVAAGMPALKPADSSADLPAEWFNETI
ncbi:Zinc finger 76 protein [Rutstroemia sp. NJR-2017a BBW]|nr:Zinc finger 76 protein [Rutstroemia sp. NJR-2017a BBW]